MPAASMTRSGRATSGAPAAAAANTRHCGLCAESWRSAAGMTAWGWAFSGMRASQKVMDRCDAMRASSRRNSAWMRASAAAVSPSKRSARTAAPHAWRTRPKPSS
ncbi:Uncharacterised protein [Bordetella pertussis]|nr:Uncharacterised protein [Bordetella pertussis]